MPWRFPGSGLKKGENEMEENIKAGIEKIRPFLQRDGGDVEFVEYTADGIVKVKLQGACKGCPGAQMTLKMVIEKILKEQYPEIQGVEAV
jgi:Fe-S cluster biogenesis protein NfuA